MFASAVKSISDLTKSLYRIVVFSCEDFDLAVGLIRSIKIREVFCI